MAYGDNGIAKYGIPDTRSLAIQTRLMITNNDYHPNCWMISKVVEMNPQGVLKISIKQDEFDIHRDNIEARVCDYYSDDGNINSQPEITPDESVGSSKINHMVIGDDGFLTLADPISSINVATTYYFSEDTSVSDFDAHWRIAIAGKEPNDPLQKLITLSDVDKRTASLRVSKTSKLYGQTIVLSLTDSDGNYYSSINLEVVA